MTGKMHTAWLFQIVLGLMLFIGLFPMPTMSMQDGHMSTSSGAGHRAPTSCCTDTIGSLVITCGVLIPHNDAAIYFAGTQRVALSPLLIPTTYREIVTPPPKI